MLLNVYGPNQDSPNFYNYIIKKINGSENDQVIICGDWNFVIDPEIDCENYVHANNLNARSVGLNFMEEENMLDVWGIMNVNCKKKYSEWT